MFILIKCMDSDGVLYQVSNLYYDFFLLQKQGGNEVGQLLHLQPLSGTESTDLLYAADAGL